jgi:hypothetical protein
MTSLRLGVPYLSMKFVCKGTQTTLLLSETQKGGKWQSLCELDNATGYYRPLVCMILSVPEVYFVLLIETLFQYTGAIGLCHRPIMAPYLAKILILP